MSVTPTYTEINVIGNYAPTAKAMTALRDGAMQLSDGLKQLNEEGFQKLVDAMDGDVEPLLERARALAGISGDYQTYSGLDAAMDGSVKFIYRTEAIG